MYRYVDHYPGKTNSELIKNYLGSPLFEDRGGYRYLVSVLENYPLFVDPKFLSVVSRNVRESSLFKGVDLIVCIEAMGIALGTALSVELNLPFAVVRKKELTSGGCKAFSAQTNYAKRTYFLSGSFSGRRIAVVDDIVASGGTLRGTVNALRSENADVISIFVLLSRGNIAAALQEELNIPVLALANVE